MRKKVILATTVPETLATILKHQPRRLAEEFDVSLVTSPGPQCEEVESNESVVVNKVQMARGIKPLSDLVSLVQMILLFVREKPYLVHSYTPKAGLICMMAAWFARVPVRIHTFTGLIFPTSHGSLKRVLMGVDRIICACASHVIPEGNGVKQDLIRFNITRKPLELIGYGNIAGVDSEFFSRAAPGVPDAAKKLEESLSLPDESFIFTFIGRLNKDKGLEELVKAFDQMPSSAYLLLGGAYDESAPISPQTLAGISAHPRVRRLGFLNDIRPLLYLSDALVLPSYREGFPNVLLQAGAMEVPVIATDINGCNEIVEPGRNGWLVPSRNVTKLVHAMETAMTSTGDLRVRYGRYARKQVLSRFERSAHWERMVSFYKSFFIPTSS